MNIQKFTQKSVAALNDLEKIAYEYGNQEIVQEHLLMSLLRQDDSLILKLVEKMEIQKEHFVSRMDQLLNERIVAAFLSRRHLQSQICVHHCVDGIVHLILSRHRERLDQLF